MALELYIWGPAFGLPSIDPECLAALSYLGHAVPQEDWSLIASNDAAISPDRMSHTLLLSFPGSIPTTAYIKMISDR